MSNFTCYLNQGSNSCWVGMKKCSQDLLIFHISLRVLALLVGRLFLRPEGFENPHGEISPGLRHRGGLY